MRWEPYIGSTGRWAPYIGSAGEIDRGNRKLRGGQKLDRKLRDGQKSYRNQAAKAAQSWLNHERKIEKGERNIVERRKKKRRVRELLTAAKQIPLVSSYPL